MPFLPSSTSSSLSSLPSSSVVVSPEVAADDWQLVEELDDVARRFFAKLFALSSLYKMRKANAYIKCLFGLLKRGGKHHEILLHCIFDLVVHN